MNSLSSCSSTVSTEGSSTYGALPTYLSQQWIAETRVVMTIYNRSVTDSDTPLKISRRLYRERNLSYSYFVIPKKGIFRQQHGKAFKRIDDTIIIEDNWVGPTAKPGYILEGAYKKVYAILNIHEGSPPWVRSVMKVCNELGDIVRYLPELRKCPEINAGYYLKHWSTQGIKKEMFLTEYMNAGDLFHQVEHDTLQLNVFQKIKVAIQVATAVEFLHARRLSHGDIKIENILINRDEKNNISARLIDFDFLHECVPELSVIWGTVGSSDPLVFIEKIKGNDALKADIFSLGVCFWSYLYCSDYFYDRDTVLRGKPLTRKDFEKGGFIRKWEIKTPLDRLIWEMCDPAPSKRPDMSRVVQCLKDIYPV